MFLGTRIYNQRRPIRCQLVTSAPQALTLTAAALPPSLVLWQGTQNSLAGGAPHASAEGLGRTLLGAIAEHARRQRQSLKGMTSRNLHRCQTPSCAALAAWPAGETHRVKK